MRSLPNIVITGTPGTGKSSHCDTLASELPDMKVFSINQVAKDRDCFEGYDEERKSHIVDEEKLVDAIEPDLEKGGLIIDWHVCDIFPEDLVDLVIVLRADTEKIYDRLQKRNYAETKLQENLDAEIMEVVLSDAREAYAEEVVIELPSNTIDDIDSNVSRIVSWKDQWVADNK